MSDENHCTIQIIDDENVNIIANCPHPRRPSSNEFDLSHTVSSFRTLKCSVNLNESLRESPNHSTIQVNKLNWEPIQEKKINTTQERILRSNSKLGELKANIDQSKEISNKSIFYSIRSRFLDSANKNSRGSFLDPYTRNFNDYKGIDNGFDIEFNTDNFIREKFGVETIKKLSSRLICEDSDENKALFNKLEIDCRKDSLLKSLLRQKVIKENEVHENQTIRSFTIHEPIQTEFDVKTYETEKKSINSFKSSSKNSTNKVQEKTSEKRIFTRTPIKYPVYSSKSNSGVVENPNSNVMKCFSGSQNSNSKLKTNSYQKRLSDNKTNEIPKMKSISSIKCSLNKMFDLVKGTSLTKKGPNSNRSSSKKPTIKYDTTIIKTESESFKRIEIGSTKASIFNTHLQSKISKTAVKFNKKNSDLMKNSFKISTENVKLQINPIKTTELKVSEIKRKDQKCKTEASKISKCTIINRNTNKENLNTMNSNQIQFKLRK